MSQNSKQNYTKIDKRKSNKRRNSGSNRQYNGRNARKDFETDEKEVTPINSKTNDVSWYSKNPEMLERAARMSFGTPNGYTSSLFDGDTTTTSKLFTPGIAVLYYTHGTGNAYAQSDAVQTAMFSLYSVLRSKQTSYSTFSPEDYMMYLLAINEVYIMYSQLARAYGLMNTINAESLYQPKKLIEALGFNYADLVRNRRDIPNVLDSIAAQLAPYHVPDVLPYMQREFWLPSGVYSDSATSKHQLYAFKPTIYRTWDDMFATGSKLQAHPYKWVDADGNIDPEATYTLNEYQELVNSVINCLIQSEDVGVLSSNVLLAYGAENLYTLGAFDPNYAILPTTDYTVLAQIENAKIVGPAETMSSFDIQQFNELNNSHIYYEPQFPVYKVAGSKVQDPRAMQSVIIAHTNDTNPEFVIEATRLMYQGTSGDTYLELDYGTEFIQAITVISSATTHDYFTLGRVHLNGGALNSPLDYELGVISLTDTKDPAMKGTLDRLAVLENFDWFPTVMIGYEYGGGATAGLRVWPLWDLDQYSKVSGEDLSILHYVALLSMFDVKTTGIANTNKR